MLSSVRFNSGGSASFISSNGLVLTNHHVAAETLYKLSSADQNIAVLPHTVWNHLYYRHIAYIILGGRSGTWSVCRPLPVCRTCLYCDKGTTRTACKSIWPVYAIWQSNKLCWPADLRMAGFWVWYRKSRHGDCCDTAWPWAVITAPHRSGFRLVISVKKAIL